MFFWVVFNNKSFNFGRLRRSQKLTVTATADNVTKTAMVKLSGIKPDSSISTSQMSVPPVFHYLFVFWRELVGEKEKVGVGE